MGSLVIGQHLEGKVMGKVDSRGRNWTFIGYPGDSLPDDYSSILTDEMHLCWAESPVHNADLNGDGSEKKRHIHFLVTFEGKKSFEQIREITDRLNCPIPQQCRNVRSMVRYMIHLDNPEKHQYKKEDIKPHGGFALEDYFNRSQSENRTILKEILAFCVDNHITEFSELVEVVFEMDNNDWIDIITCRNTLFLSAYLKSKYFRDTRIESEKVLRERMKKLGPAIEDKKEGDKHEKQPEVCPALGPGGEVHRGVPGGQLQPETGELRLGHGGAPGAAGPGLGAAPGPDQRQAP